MGKRLQTEYRRGNACGRVHIPSVDISRMNTAILDFRKPMIQSFWRGYRDGMNRTSEFAREYGL